MLAVVRRHELSDAEWAVLSRLLPSSGTAGRPRSDDRVVLNGIVWKLRTGSAWRDVPERYGSWQTLYTRFRRWALDGTSGQRGPAITGDSSPRRLTRRAGRLPLSGGPEPRPWLPRTFACRGPTRTERGPAPERRAGCGTAVPHDQRDGHPNGI